jgi:soluble lytic murein transglycosylase-like protein
VVENPAPAPSYAPGDVAPIVDAYASYIRTVNSRVGHAQATEWAGYIVRYASEVGLDPRLQIALIVAESDFKPQTTSSKGAMGLCQLMNDEVRRFGLTDPYDPKQNIYASTRLLREGIDKYVKMGYDNWNATILALAGYNAGHGAVKKYGYSVPPYRETQGYVRKITGLYRTFVGN